MNVLRDYMAYSWLIQLTLISSFLLQLFANYVVVERWILPRDVIEELPYWSVTSCIMKCYRTDKCITIGFIKDPAILENDKCLLVKILRRENKNGTRIKVFALLDEEVVWEDERIMAIAAAKKQQLCLADVHGGYGNWSNFTVCTKTCGSGVQYRNRSCNHPAPRFGGRDCSALRNDTETRSCNTNPCPIHGGYGNWSNFTICTKTCGSGVQYRNRSCNHPAPRFGGLDCSVLGVTDEVRSCNENPCPIDGGYGQWSSYDTCSRDCNSGIQSRSRLCDSPSPMHGGNDCTYLGNSTETQSCNTVGCLVFKQIRGTCISLSQTECDQQSKTEGGSFGTSSRSSYPPGCYWKTGNSFYFNTLSTSTKLCNTERRCVCKPDPIDGGYGQWSSYDTCSRDCNSGTQSRSRSCDSPSPMNGGNDCTSLGNATETRSCNTVGCLVFKQIRGTCKSLSQTECDQHRKTQGGSFSTNSGSNYPPGCYFKTGNSFYFNTVSTSTTLCNTERRCVCKPIDGAYGPWSSYDTCSRDCNSGSQSRSRLCDSPPPNDGGMDCTSLGNDTDTQICNTASCSVFKQIRGACTSLSQTECDKQSKTEGGSFSTNSGSYPPGCYWKSGNRFYFNTQSTSSILCNAERRCVCKPDPIDGGYGQWSSYGSCSKTCGSGVQSRSRSCDSPTPMHGGNDCTSLGSATETQSCSAVDCAVYLKNSGDNNCLRLSESECQQHSTSKGYSMSIVSSSSFPAGCYYKPGNKFYFNSLSTSTTLCTSVRNCVCKTD